MVQQEPHDKPSSVFGMGGEQIDRILALGLEDGGADTAAPTLSLHPLMEQPGAQIGRYRLLRVLGEGGMGIVYLAEQTRPVRRQVALKIIKPGMDSKRVLARFEVEEQALAMMEHTHIARVYDAGLSPSGRPYFVMEHVRGLPITQHCDEQQLTIEQRLCLFLQVCEAVQHAHQKGIIHRDIKPSNILVAVQGDEAIVKIIDFGVARAISLPLTERTLYTEQGQLIGTPEYTSPEQANLTNQDIDTRTDVYSLGMVLYELLAGVLPFDTETFRTGGIDHIRKVICEQDPATPSTRLSKTSEQESFELARRRQAEVRVLQRKLHGDLDWITLKALEKDRNRRYATVDALAGDIRAYLHHQPVSAAPPGILYQAGKFVRRHRQAMTAAAAVIVLLLLLGWAIRAHVKAETQEERRVLAEAQKLMETGGARGTANPSSDVLALLRPFLDNKRVGPQAKLLSASVLAEYRYYDEARAKLDDLINKQRETPPEVAGTAHALLARIIWESQSLGTRELKQIEEHQQRAEQLLPTTAEAYYLRAMTALTIQKRLRLLDKALRLDSAHYPSRRLRALTYYASRRYEELRDDALLMTFSHPTEPLGYSLRAAALWQLGHCEDALTCYDAALELTPPEAPQYIELNCHRCEVLMHMEQYDLAIDYARECLRKLPKATSLRPHIFCALTALGEYQEAASFWSSAVASDPAARTQIRDWSMKYVFDILAAGGLWHPVERVPEGPAFLPLQIAEETYHDLSGKAHRLVTDCFSGSWSPGGTQVAFSMGVHGYSGVAVYDVNTGKTDLLIVPGKDPRWSPDGRYVAFVRDCGVLRLSELMAAERRFHYRAYEDEELWVMNADGTDPRRLARSAGWPSWSGDGKRLYYQSRADSMLYSIAIDDRQVQATPILPCSSPSPSVSPDEGYAAYVEDGALKIAELTTGSCVSQWTMPLPMWGGHWSPDQHEFAFGGSRQVECRAGLWLYDVAKQEAKTVLAGQINEAEWSLPDGRQLLFALGPPYYEVWVANLDPNISTVEALGPARNVDENLQDWIEGSNVQLAVDPNLLYTHWVRTAAAIWIRDDRVSLYLDQLKRFLDREPDLADTCDFIAKATFARPAVNERVLPLTLLLVHRAIKEKPAYARGLAPLLYHAGQQEEAARLWQISEAVTPKGSCRYDKQSNTYTITGSGADIWGRFDDFHFAHKELQGDGSITVRLDSIENIREWTKAGLMIRGTLDPDSPNAALLVTPRGSICLQYRHAVGGATARTYAPPNSVQLPHRLKLIRRGNRFTAQHSPDGAIWQDVFDGSDRRATIEIPMDHTVYIGLAVTSQDVARTAEARFTQVTIAGDVSPAGPFTDSQDIWLRFPAAPH